MGICMASSWKKFATRIGLFTSNSNGTVTLNCGVFSLGQYSLTVVDPPGPSVAAPEPASLILLSFGGLALGALRRHKAN
jgi:hypothetical protein